MGLLVSPWHTIVYFVVVCIPIFVSFSAFALYWAEFLFSALESNLDGETFDFIIVGGGSAGAVLANRLSEVSSYRVLLLEAGGSPTFLSGIPALASYLQLSAYDWQHKTTPQENACGAMVRQECLWPSGKVLGGSSGINYMLHVRGHPEDYSRWGEDWSYKHVLPYFLKSEGGTAEKQSPEGGNAAHLPEDRSPQQGGNTAHLPLDVVRYTTPLSLEYEKMVREAGYSIKDLNSSLNQTGFSLPIVNQVDGVRGDTYRSFIKPALDRPNLIIRKHARVEKILFKNKQAVGVTFVRYGASRSVYASREVLVSAGTINSAKLLMLSGIGPADHLTSLGIKVEEDLPVGKNLHDHLTTSIGPFILNKPVSFLPGNLLSFQTFRDYLYEGKGPMATTCAIDLMGNINTPSNFNNTNNPDIQILFVSSALTADYWTFLHKTFGFKQEVWDNYYKKLYFPRNFNAVSILPVILRPKSRGELRLKSSNPTDAPLINPKYLTEESDVTDLVDGIQAILAMVNASTHLKHLDFKMPDIHFPGCESQELFSREYWTCYIKQVSLTMYHPVGTCKMALDKSGVVDPELRVKGLDRIRVVDASVMPSIVSGNTNAATVMIAERAADLIKARWPVDEKAKTTKRKVDEL